MRLGWMQAIRSYATLVALRPSALYFRLGCRVSTKQSARSAAELAVKGRNRARLRFVCPVYDSKAHAIFDLKRGPGCHFRERRKSAQQIVPLTQAKLSRQAPRTRSSEVVKVRQPAPRSNRIWQQITPMPLAECARQPVGATRNAEQLDDQS
jgi:hypothetical protein